MEFTPCLEEPSNLYPYWIKTTYGGYNRCIVINRTTGSVLPNCTGWAWGRFLQENHLTNCSLSRGNAEVWYPYYMDGYQRGQTPKLGAIICWHSTRSGGHVAIVEVINSDGSIVTSNSAYNGKTFYTKTLYPPNYYMGNAYTFQGFIYPPNDFDPNPPEPKVKHKKHFKWVLYSRKLQSKR